MDEAYIGFFDLGATVYDAFVTRNGSRVAASITGSLTYNVYSADLSSVLVTGTTNTTLGSETGVYKYSFTASEGNGFESGKNYLIIATYVISSVTYTAEHYFTVT